MTLSSAAIELLLELLEGPEPVIGGLAASLHKEDIEALHQHGLLRSDGRGHVAIIPMGDDDHPAEVFTFHPGGPLVAFDPHSGLVPIADDQVQRWRVDVDVLLRRLTERLDLGAEIRPMELIPGLLWEIGMVRIGRRPARQPLWFAGQLGTREIQRRVAEAATVRPYPGHRVLLTSTCRDLLDGFALPSTTVIPVSDVFERGGVLTISADVVSALVSGVTGPTASGPVVLSEDDGMLKINGMLITLRSARHRGAARRLVDAYRSGQRLHITKIIGQDSGSRSLDQFFGHRLFEQLDPFLGRDRGHWWLEP